jgi:hypothetical protein
MATEKIQATTYLDAPLYDAIKRKADAEQRTLSQAMAILLAEAIARSTKPNRR